MALFTGTKILIGGETYVLPALSLGQLRAGGLEKLKEHDEAIVAGNSFAASITRGEIIFLALQRNYPDFDETVLMNHLDLCNTIPLWQIVLGSSGFTLGETEGAEVTEKSTGISAPSTEA
jgi:hypothetical protein